METKSWYKSKTVWTNLLTAIGGVGAVVMGEVSLGAGVAPIVLAVINIALRIVTGKPISG